MTISETSNDNSWSAGTVVCLKHNPEQKGILTGEIRNERGSPEYQVKFEESRVYQPVNEIELVGDGFLPAGTRVRLTNNPGQQGTLTGEHKVVLGKVKYQVDMINRVSYMPYYAIEEIHEQGPSRDQLIRERKFGRVRDLRRNLTHVQLTGNLANLVYSMDATNTDFYAYQYKPVLSFLESPSKGLLIADEVGLGKTIEAGLIWTELRARIDARRLMVVCPSMLCEKWRIELRERFGVTAGILKAEEVLEYLKQDRYRVPDGTGIICSLQGLRPPRGWRNEKMQNRPTAKLARFLEEHASEDPLLDLVIVDEAHYLRNPETQNAKLGHLLQDVTEHIVLLSATPINLGHDDLFHLLNLVDPDSFQNKDEFPSILSANEPLQEARRLAMDGISGIDKIRSALISAGNHPRLRKNRQLNGLVSFVENELKEPISNTSRVQMAARIDKINLLSRAVTRTRKREVSEWRVIREPVIHPIEMDEGGMEQRFYREVTETIRAYAEDHDVSDRFLLAAPQRQVSSCMYAAAEAWKERHNDYEEQIYEDFGHDDNLINFSPLIEELRGSVLPGIDIQELKKNDSKYRKLQKTLKEDFFLNKNEKVIIFSFFRKTLSYLAERLSEDGFTARVLTGGMGAMKHEIIKEFRESADVSILLSSEVASEGIDLQFCRILFNYDLPWNPMRIEQRIGRLDRIGQKAERISIINLLLKDTIDYTIYDRLHSRLDIFRHALGGMEAILGQTVKQLTSELLLNELSDEQIDERMKDIAKAVENNKLQEENLDRQASGLFLPTEYFLEQINAARNLKKRITDEDLKSYVQDYLETFCQGYEFRRDPKDELKFTIKLPASTTALFIEYLDEHKLRDRTRLIHGGAVECKFSNNISETRAKVEVINHIHPLVRFIGHELKNSREAYYPLVAIHYSQKDSTQYSPGTYAFFVNLWEFSGIKKEHEIASRAVHMESNTILNMDESWSLINSARLDGSDWREASENLDIESLSKALEICEGTLDEDFDSESDSKKNQNEDRIDLQLDTAQEGRNRKVQSREEIIRNHEASGNTRMIPAIRGQIRKIDERFEIHKEKMKLGRSLNADNQEVCRGAILVE